MNAGHRIVLVSGIPGAGKTNYCEWLEQKEGFLHLDVDQLLVGNGAALKLSLINSLGTNPTDFLSKSSKITRSVVIDWGFPVASLSLVKFFQDNGVAIWWFDGDRVAARQSFERRGDAPLEAFQFQMNSIRQNWKDILEIIKDKQLEVIKPGPTYVPHKWIFEQMFG